MVSLPDAQCARAQRYHHGRSMRTVRSYLFHHRHSPPPATHSGAISENLTDSLVDFKLRELAVTPAPAQSEPADAPEELLDLSREFSDCSSFGSDISGELQRLASFARSEAPQGALSSEIAGFEALALSGLGSWSDIQESPSVEGVEPMVRACVECLGSALPEAKREAAARIRLLAKHRSDFRTLIGASGAIPALVPLLRCTDPAAQESAATALLNLSLEETNKGRIAAAGAIKPLVYALRTGTAVAKQNAACALLNLSMIEENRATIGACGAIPPLVALLVGGTSRGKKDALTTLYKLCSTRRNKERAVSAGAAAPLVGMVVEHGGGTAEKAMVVLGSLAAFPEGRDAIVEAGGIPALVETIEAGPSSGREFAVHALLLLCADSARNRGLLVREGAIPPLVALSQCASARAKLKAETLLVYLREQRQDLAREALQNYPELLQEHSEKKKDILQLDQKQPSIAKVQLKYLKRKMEMERSRSAVSTAMTVGDKLPQSTVLSHALTAPLHMGVEEHYCRCSRQNLARSLSPFCLLCCRKLQCGP